MQSNKKAQKKETIIRKQMRKKRNFVLSTFLFGLAPNKKKRDNHNKANEKKREEHSIRAPF